MSAVQPEEFPLLLGSLQDCFLGGCDPKCNDVVIPVACAENFDAGNEHFRPPLSVGKPCACNNVKDVARLQSGTTPRAERLKNEGSGGGGLSLLGGARGGAQQPNSHRHQERHPRPEH